MRTDPTTAAARRLTDEAARLDAAAHALATADPGSTTFGAAAPGRLGELGRALHAQWQADIADRSRTAATLANRLAEAARSLQAAASSYDGAESTATRQSQQVGEP